MAPAAKSAAIDKSSSEKPKIEKKEKNPVNEIEEIFKAAKGKKKRKAPPPPPSSSSSSAKKSAKSKVRNEDKGSKEKTKKFAEGDGSSKKRRRTGDGLTIYSADELGIGNPEAGGTALCPFDCACCF